MTLMAQADFAKHRGVGKSAVSNWKKAGLLVMGECPASGRIMVDVERSEARINARIDPMRGRPSVAMPAASPIAPFVSEDLPLVQRNAAQVRMELGEEDLIARRLRNAEASKELVPRIEAERRMGELARVFRERMQAMFRGNAERFAAEREVRGVMALGIAEIDRVCAQLASDIETGILASDDQPEDPEVDRQVERDLAEV